MVSFNWNGTDYTPTSMTWFVAALALVCGMLCGHVEGCSMALGVQAPMEAKTDVKSEVLESRANLLHVEFKDANCYCVGGQGCWGGEGAAVSCVRKLEPFER